MADSTFFDEDERQAAQRQALQDAIESAEECEALRDAVVIYGVAATAADRLHDDTTVRLPAAEIVSGAALDLVIAAANYHTARVVYAVQDALLTAEVKKGGIDGRAHV
jgi:hypothetical protein